MELEKNRAYRYIELCEYFGEDIKSGSSKTAQINRWRRYYDIEKIGSKYLILDIYTDEDLTIKGYKKYKNSLRIDKDGRFQYFDVPMEDEQKAGVYKIYNAETNEIYIGQTTHFINRFHQHWNNDRGAHEKTSDMLHRGAVFSIIEICEDEVERKDKEGKYIKKYIDEGYNVKNERMTKEWISVQIKIRRKDKEKLMSFVESLNCE